MKRKNGNNSKKQKGGFLRMLLGTLGASLLVNLSAGKDRISAGEDFVRADQYSKFEEQT